MLPSEIIEYILLRLPVKSLLRFRCVCRSWCALISDTHFINLHLGRSTETNDHIVMERCRAGFSSNGEAYLLHNAYGSVVKLNYPSVVSMLGCSSNGILSYCNGLICIWDENDMICLWNPFTRKHRILPQFTRRSSFLKKKSHDGLGLGYNPVSKNHEVVRVLESEVEVYSLDKNSWTRIGNIPHMIYYQNRGAVSVGASLHWPVTRETKTISYALQPNSIISLNMVTRTFQTFHLPEYEWENYEWSTDLTCWTNISELDGCLCVLRDHHNRTEIWVMKEYGMKESWVKVFTSSELRLPLCITKKGDFIVHKVCRKSLCLHDPKEQTSQNLAWEGNPATFRIGTTFTESLIQP
ncbi:hypothetical protein ACHQM5_001186 [Ranunculus cassubicifolius]